jgi:putative YphP/YqiW family bacilliredoxin
MCDEITRYVFLRRKQQMPYSELMIRPFREELTQIGVEETRTPDDVEAALATDGTVMVVVNSVCGCAAGKARPGIARALKNPALPDKVVTVFAGADIEATERARSYFAPYPPSSPQIAILKDKKVLFMLERHQIQDRTADQIASVLAAA